MAKRASKRDESTVPSAPAEPVAPPARTPLNFAIAHAFRGVTFVTEWKDGNDDSTKPVIRRLKDEDDKQTFLMDFVEGDHLYLENGGANDRISLFALSAGAHVFAIPTFALGNKGAVERLLSESTSWDVAEEKAAGEETTDELTARK